MTGTNHLEQKLFEQKDRLVAIEEKLDRMIAKLNEINANLDAMESDVMTVREKLGY